MNLWLYADLEETPRLIIDVDDSEKINVRLVARVMTKQKVEREWVIKLYDQRGTKELNLNRAIAVTLLEAMGKNAERFIALDVLEMIVNIREVDDDAQGSDNGST